MNTMMQPARYSAWDVFNDPDRFVEGFSRVLRPATDSGQAIVPAVDVTESDNEYLVRAELPGVKKEDLDVSIQDGVLTINAETKYEHDEKDNGRIIRQERRYGKIVRSMRLGDDVDASKVKADYKQGVLSLVLPKHEEVAPKKIDVKVV